MGSPNATPANASTCLPLILASRQSGVAFWIAVSETLRTRLSCSNTETERYDGRMEEDVRVHGRGHQVFRGWNSGKLFANPGDGRVRRQYARFRIACRSAARQPKPIESCRDLLKLKAFATQYHLQCSGVNPLPKNVSKSSAARARREYLVGRSSRPGPLFKR